MPLAFISSAYRGHTVYAEQAHARIAAGMCLLAFQAGLVPFASHLLYTQLLDDHNPAHRSFGITAGHKVMPQCCAVYVYEPHLATSIGVQADLELAKQLDKPIVMVTFESVTEALSEIRPSRLYAPIFGEQ